jgi:adenosine deaminase
MWEMAHAQGIRLPTKHYWKFVDLITINAAKVKSFEEYLELFKWTELIQSSPLAIERSVYATIAGAYRKNNITLLELRFNPMKRNRGGEQDLDQIMMAAIRGLDRASLEYPVRTGMIICLDRQFDLPTNKILLDKALRYQSRGVVGIDIAGGASKLFRYADYRTLYRRANKAGLGLTVHAGEDQDYKSVKNVIDHLEPDRIGHGVRAVANSETLELLKERGIVLEVCPSSNLHTGVVKGVGALKEIFLALKRHKVGFTINTDGPEMLMTNLRGEMDFLLRNSILDVGDILESNKTAFAASFMAGRS